MVSRIRSIDCTVTMGQKSSFTSMERAEECGVCYSVPSIEGAEEYGGHFSVSLYMRGLDS